MNRSPTKSGRFWTATSSCRASLAARNHYPAINILESASRVMGAVTDKDHRKSAGALRDALATYKKNEDLILLGAYKSGADKRVDDAIAKISAIDSFLEAGDG